MILFCLHRQQNTAYVTMNITGFLDEMLCRMADMDSTVTNITTSHIKTSEYNCGR